MNKKLLIPVVITACLQFTQARDGTAPGHLQTEKQEISTHRVVFMGNSITSSWSVIHPEYFKKRGYINCGISGQTTAQMLLRFERDVIQAAPELVVILAGTNDIAENAGPVTINEIMSNITSMVNMARSHHIKVVLCSVLPVIQYSWRKDIKPVASVMGLNSLINEYARQNNIEYVDFFSAMADHSNGLKSTLGKDTVHPNARGYAVMEPLLEAAIKKALGE